MNFEQEAAEPGVALMDEEQMEHRQNDWQESFDSDKEMVLLNTTAENEHDIAAVVDKGQDQYLYELDDESVNWPVGMEAQELGQQSLVVMVAPLIDHSSIVRSMANRNAVLQVDE